MFGRFKRQQAEELAERATVRAWDVKQEATKIAAERWLKERSWYSERITEQDIQRKAIDILAERLANQVEQELRVKVQQELVPQILSNVDKNNLAHGLLMKISEEIITRNMQSESSGTLVLNPSYKL